MYDHLKKLQMISFFKAPAHKKIKPVAIGSGFEYLELVTDGHVFFSGPNGKNTIFGRGTLFWHKKGENTIYRYPEDDPYSCYVFRFEVENVKRRVPRISFPLHTEQLIGFAADSFRNYHSGEQENPAFAVMIYSTLVWYATGVQRILGTQFPKPLKIALDFMENHLDSPLHLDEIAAVAEISQPYLFTIFKRYLNISPHQYLLGLRISRAKQMLAGCDLTIKEIAFECGFESLEVFYRQFLHNTGTTPAIYRKRSDPMDSKW